MTSLRVGGICSFACCFLIGCGITVPGGFNVDLDPSIGAAGSGGTRAFPVAGRDVVVDAGRNGGVAGGIAGYRGGTSGTGGGVAGAWGGYAGTWALPVAGTVSAGTAGYGGTWGGYAGTWSPGTSGTGGWPIAGTSPGTSGTGAWPAAGTWAGWAAGAGSPPKLDQDRDGWDNQSDCDDYNASVFPWNMDACCDYFDSDCDGRDAQYGSSCSCDPTPPPREDNDRDGWATFDGDCNDWDPSMYPGAYEVCFDGRDGNCDGLSDYEDWNCRVMYDWDADGYGQAVDCNDFDPNIRPDAAEACGDGIDNNCDGLVDPYPYCGEQTVDWDRDGYPYQKDCNDGDSSVYPGSPYEICCDGIDSNCDGADGFINGFCTCPTPGDRDGDGYGIGMSDPALADCNDQDPSIHPNAVELCGDNLDNNCNGLIDAQDAQCIAMPID
jgi:Putative metal-binding motif